MDTSVGFSQLFGALVELFGFIYTAGYLLWDWLSTPLSESAGEYVGFLGDFAGMTPIQFMFGPALILILVLALVKFVNPF